MNFNSVKLYLHVCVDNATLWWFLERTRLCLMLDNPVSSVANFLFVHRYIVLGLVETFGNKCTQPACSQQLISSAATYNS